MDFILGTTIIEAKNTKLSSLREHVRDWARIEVDLQHSMHEEGPSEEVFTNLKGL